MLKKNKSILLFLLGLLISIFLGYSFWESDFFKNAADKNSQEQQLAEDTSEQDKAAADKAAADKAAEEQAAADKAAADKAAEEQAATEKAAADKAAEEQAAADKAAADKAAEVKAQKRAEIQKAMGFDVLRIEPTGGAVIAGLALAGSKTEIINVADQSKSIAEATASDVGQFAMVLDTPLGVGKHEIVIQATDADGNKIISDEVALVEIFDASLNKTPVVILSKTGVATRMLQGEETQVAEENASEEATTTDETSTQETTAETEQAEAKPEPVNAVFIKAADVEGDKLIIAGTGPADGTLNIYLNDQLLGQTKIAENNSYLFEKSQTLEAGRHKIRADRVDPATNKVLGRAEVSLIHEPEVAAVEETTTTETSTEQTAVEESTSEATTEEVTTEQAASEEAATQETTSEDATQDQASTSEAEQSTDQASSEGTTGEEASNELRTGTTVIIRRGDSLWRVSHKNYGEGMKFTTIFEANKDQIRDPNLIYPGQVFTIPEAQ